MTTPKTQTIWAAGIQIGCRVFRAHSEDRTDERDRELLGAWSATVRELLAALPGDGHPTTDEWDAMVPEAKVSACARTWFDFTKFTFAVQRVAVTDVLNAYRLN